MKIELQLNDKGYCEEFKIDGEPYSQGIERVLIDCECETKIDMFVNERFFDETKLEENNLINIYKK